MASKLSAVGAFVVSLTLCAPAAAAEPTRPLEQAVVVRDAGPCINEGALLQAVAAWLHTYSVDARLSILVTRREQPRPTLSFWVWRRGKPIAERHLPVQGESCDGVMDALAFAVALAIDATILEAPAQSKPPEQPAPTAPESPAPAPRAPSLTGGVWLGPAWVMASGDVGSWLAGSIGSHVQPVWPLTIEAELALTLTGGSTELDSGRADTSLGWLRSTLLVEPWPRAALSPAWGLGGGPLLAWSTADAAPGAVATDDQTVVALLCAKARLGVALSRHLTAALALTAGFAVPEPVLRADRQPAATLGRPLIEVAVTAGYTWR